MPRADLARVRLPAYPATVRRVRHEPDGLTVRRKQGGNRPPLRPRPPDVSRQGETVPASPCRLPCALWRDLCRTGNRSTGDTVTGGNVSRFDLARVRLPACPATVPRADLCATFRADLPAMSRTDGQPCANRGNRARHARDVSPETGRQPPAVASAPAGRVAARVRRARVPVPFAVRPVRRSRRNGSTVRRDLSGNGHGFDRRQPFDRRQRLAVRSRRPRPVARSIRQGFDGCASLCRLPCALCADLAGTVQRLVVRSRGTLSRVPLPACPATVQPFDGCALDLAGRSTGGNRSTCAP